MGKFNYDALGTFTSVILGAGTAPTLKNLANNGRKLGSEVDLTGAGAREFMAWFDLLLRSASAPAANAPIELYLLNAVDGTNYERGDDSTDPPATSLIHIFPCAAIATGYRLTTGPRPIIIPACKFKPLIYNKSGQALTNTDNENVLSIRVVAMNVA